MKKIAVIGAGNVGTALAQVLQDKGYALAGVCCRTEASAGRAAGRLGCTIFTDPGALARRAEIVFITTPDRSIEAVCRRLAGKEAVGPGQVVLHTSGAHSSSILASAGERGAAVLSMHPLQTFPDVEAGIRNLKGSYFTLEGDQRALPVGLALVEALEGRPLTIPTAMKPLYHAAACVACNYFVSLIGLALQMMEKAGVPGREALPALLPLVEGTLNNIKRVGVPAALTGPIDRGDHGTVAAHLRVIEEVMPAAKELYCSLGRQTAQTARAKGTLDEAGRREFQNLLHQDS